MYDALPAFEGSRRPAPLALERFQAAVQRARVSRMKVVFSEAGRSATDFRGKEIQVSRRLCATIEDLFSVSPRSVGSRPHADTLAKRHLAGRDETPRYF